MPGEYKRIILERHNAETIAVAVSNRGIAANYESEEQNLNMMNAGKGGSIASA